MNAKLSLRRMLSWISEPDGAMALAIVLLLLLAVASHRLPHFPGPDVRGEIAAARTQLSHTRAALDAFKAAVGGYPTADEGLRALVEKPATVPAGWTRPFIQKIPRDPWGHDYQYTCPGTYNIDSYHLYSLGPDGKPGGGDDITNWEESR